MINAIEELLDVGVWHLDPIADRVLCTKRCTQALGLGAQTNPICAQDLFATLKISDRDDLIANLKKLSTRDSLLAMAVVIEIDQKNVSLSIRAQFSSKQSSGIPSGFWITGVVTAAQAVDNSAEIRRLSCYDSLTGLPNRLLFREQLSYTVRAAQRDNSVVAVLIIEVGDLRRLSDVYGRQASDQIVKGVSERLVGCVRSSDLMVSSDLLGKMGGLSRIETDQFAIVLSRLKEPQDAARVAKRMIDAMAVPIITDQIEAYPPISIGIALCPWDAGEPDQLAQSASLALDHARKLGNNRVMFFNRGMNSIAADRLELESSLRRALDRREFVLYFQQRVHAITGLVQGNEALIRWNHPERGIVSPGVFIDLAEQSRLIVPLGSWVLEEACMQNADWIRRGFSPVPVAVNISAVQFSAQGFVNSVRRALELAELAPEHLELEITESVVMGDTQAAIERLREIKALGCKVAIDDFGTGFSSLAYLRDFPADYLKIDRSFVSASTKDDKSKAITFAVIDLAKRLNMGVIAEGVETEEQLQLLSLHGCTDIQGFLFSKPVAPFETELLWRQRLSNPGRALRLSQLLPAENSGKQIKKTAELV